MAWLLDTNILIAISKRHPVVLPKLERIASSAIVLSSVVLAEIEDGIAKSTRQEINQRVYGAITSSFAVQQFDLAAAREFGIPRTELEKQDRVIGPYDMLIAAHALSLDCTLVTDNVRDVRRGLRRSRRAVILPHGPQSRRTGQAQRSDHTHPAPLRQDRVAVPVGALRRRLSAVRP